MNELEETLIREGRDGGNAYLIPVRLDDFVLGEWNPERLDLAQAVRTASLRISKEHADEAKFDAELAKLIRV